MPLISQESILHLWSHSHKKADIVIPMTQKKLQPMCAFYHKRVHKICTQQIKDSNFGLNELVRCTKFQKVDCNKLIDSFFNMNTKKDLDLVKQKLELTSNKKCRI